MAISIITDYDWRTIRVPVYAQVSAGRPLDDSPIIGWREIRRPRNYSPNHKYCAMIINGNSLEDNGILSGDYAIVRLTNRLERVGQLCVVLTPDGLTLKYVHPLPNGEIQLAGASRLFTPLLYRIDETSLQGIVVRTERDYQ